MFATWKRRKLWGTSLAGRTGDFGGEIVDRKSALVLRCTPLGILPKKVGLVLHDGVGPAHELQQAFSFCGRLPFFPQGLNSCLQICDALLRFLEALERHSMFSVGNPPYHLNALCPEVVRQSRRSDNGASVAFRHASTTATDTWLLRWHVELRVYLGAELSRTIPGKCLLSSRNATAFVARDIPSRWV